MRLALGTVQFGLAYGIANRAGKIGAAEAKQILRLARESGIDTLDTAISYGESEGILGASGVQSFKIITKLPMVPYGVNDVEKWIEHQIEASLIRLQRKSVYCVLLHCSGDLHGESGKKIIRSINQLKTSGVTEKIGISIYDPKELEKAMQVIEIDLVQAPLNLIDRRLETSGWLQRLHSHGVEIHARSVFLQGLLLLKRDEIPEKFNRWKQLWDYWHKSLNESRTSAIAACLSYPLSLRHVDKVVVGVDSASQLYDLIQLSNNFKNPQLDWASMISEDIQLINPSQWTSI
jgi:aryl-alcohol dehydrogenase-like predicted oxidoreductase